MMNILKILKFLKNHHQKVIFSFQRVNKTLERRGFF